MFWQKLNGNFSKLALLVGMIFSIFSLRKVIGNGLEEHPNTYYGHSF